MNGPEQSLPQALHAAVQLTQTGHSPTALHFEALNDGNAGQTAIRCEGNPLSSLVSRAH
jgi:hypothetical protein